MPRISMLSSNFGGGSPTESVPLHLTAGVTLQPNAQSGPNSEALMNPMSVPMEIHEIKFRMDGGATGENHGRLFTGGGVGCRLDYGQVALTNGFVPLFSFCRAYNPMDEAQPAGQIYRSHFKDFVFQLPKPLYVPAGQAIQPQFQHFGQTNTPIDVDISFSGRSLVGAPKPKNISLPYVAAYKSIPFAADSASIETAESQEVDLKNPFGHDLHIERFVGRTDFNLTTGGINVVFEIPIPGVGNDAPANYEVKQLAIRMFDSRGEPTIPVFTPFGAVFPKATRAWECPHLLGANGYYKVFLEKAAEVDDINGVLYSQAYVSMIGWHDVPLASI